MMKTSHSPRKDMKIILFYWTDHIYFANFSKWYDFLSLLATNYHIRPELSPHKCRLATESMPFSTYQHFIFLYIVLHLLVNSHSSKCYRILLWFRVYCKWSILYIGKIFPVNWICNCANSQNRKVLQYFFRINFPLFQLEKLVLKVTNFV